MKRLLIIILFFISVYSCFGAYQYNVKGNQGWLSFDSKTTLSFDVSTSGKDKEHENFIDNGNGIADYGWYNLNTGETGSFKNGLTASFSENDKIGLYITDNKGKTYMSTKPGKTSPFENDIWGKSKYIDGTIMIGGGNFGSNGTHEYYVFKVNSANNNSNTPTGQPLPGILATLIVGSIAIWYLKNRKHLLHI
jgi:hypothetical protein